MDCRQKEAPLAAGPVCGTTAGPCLQQPWLPACPPDVAAGCCLRVQDLKCDTEEDRAAYEELQAQLLAAHPTHLPLLLERLQRAQRAAAAAKGDAALQKVRLYALEAATHQTSMKLSAASPCTAVQAGSLPTLQTRATCSLPARRRRWSPLRTRWQQPSTLMSWPSTWHGSAPRRAPAPRSARRVGRDWAGSAAPGSSRAKSSGLGGTALPPALLACACALLYLAFCEQADRVCEPRSLGCSPQLEPRRMPSCPPRGPSRSQTWRSARLHWLRPWRQSARRFWSSWMPVRLRARATAQPLPKPRARMASLQRMHPRHQRHRPHLSRLAATAPPPRHSRRRSASCASGWTPPQMRR